MPQNSEDAPSHTQNAPFAFDGTETTARVVNSATHNTTGRLASRNRELFIALVDADDSKPVQIMDVRPLHEDNYERLCHDTDIPAFFLPMRTDSAKPLPDELLKPHLERAIGVVYRPDTELLSHYFQASVPA